MIKPGETAISLQAIQLSYFREQGPLFSDLDLALQAGQACIVEGDNGSGKSTLLRLLAGILTPSHGKICFQGQCITQVPENYHANLHFLGHAHGGKAALTVLENLELATRLSGLPIPTQTTLFNVLEKLSLAHKAHLPIRQLSAGQQRRAGLARLFLIPKKIWILDEPLTALDAPMRTQVLDHLHSHCHSGGMAVISTHHPIDLPDTTLHRLRLPAC